MKAFFKTLLHTVGGAAVAGGLGALGGADAAKTLLWSIAGSAVSSAISAILPSSLKTKPAK
jgi:hypothetical protein